MPWDCFFFLSICTLLHLNNLKFISGSWQAPRGTSSYFKQINHVLSVGPPQGVEQARYYFQAVQVPRQSVAARWLISAVLRVSTIPMLQARANDLSNSMHLPDSNTNRTDVQRESWDGGVIWEGETHVWTHFLCFFPVGCMWEVFAIVSEVLQMTPSLGLVSIVSWSLITKCGVKYGSSAGRTQHTSHLLCLQCRFFMNVCK